MNKTEKKAVERLISEIERAIRFMDRPHSPSAASMRNAIIEARIALCLKVDII